MGDKDSNTQKSGQRTEDSCESLESLPNVEEQRGNFREDPSQPGRSRLKSISMSDLDEEHHLSDNLRSRTQKSISASDLEDKPQLSDNMKNYVHHPVHMGSIPPSPAESGIVAGGSCWPTPKESLESLYNREEQSKFCENPRMMYAEIEVCQGELEDSEDKEEKKESAPQEIELCQGEMGDSEDKEEKKESAPQEVELCLGELGDSNKVEKKELAPQEVKLCLEALEISEDKVEKMESAPEEVKLCLEALEISEDKVEKMESAPQEIELCLGEMGDSEDKVEKKESAPQEVKLCLEELEISLDKVEKMESSPQEEQSLLPINGERKVKQKEKKKSSVSDVSLRCGTCRRSVKIPLWLIVGFFVFFVIIIVVLSALLSRRAVTDASSYRPPCEKSWINVNGRCYYFSEVSKTWNDSRDFCTRHGSTLAVLIDQEIKETIKRYRENVNYWIGLSMDDSGQWRWSNGSLYKGRVENEDRSRLRCAFLNSHLGALDCSTGRQWICVQDSS